MIPFLDLNPMHSAIEQEMQATFTEVYHSNQFILREKLVQFEADWAEFSLVEHAVGVSSGLDALFLSLKALGIGAGDEVIIPAHTFIATALAVVHTGATPVLADVNPDTFNIDASGIEQAITSKTKAIIPVHLYGLPCDMDLVMNIAEENQLFVIEDNAQAQGAMYKDKPTGSFGHLAATSFYPAKNIGAFGDGGMVTTRDKELAQKIKKLRNYGASQKYDHELAGYNMRLDELQAAFLSVKLKYLQHWNAERQQIAQLYHEYLSGIQELTLPVKPVDAEHVYHLYVARTPERDRLIKFLATEGIQTSIHYPLPVHLQKPLINLGYRQGDFPVAEKICKSCISLPLYPGLDHNLVEKVSARIAHFFSN